MTPSEYLQSLPDKDLIEEYDWFNQPAEEGWETCCQADITPYGAITKKLVEQELARRAPK